MLLTSLLHSYLLLTTCWAQIFPEDVVAEFIESPDFQVYQQVGSDPQSADEELRAAFFCHRRWPIREYGWLQTSKYSSNQNSLKFIRQLERCISEREKMGLLDKAGNVETTPDKKPKAVAKAVAKAST